MTAATGRRRALEEAAMAAELAVDKTARALTLKFARHAGDDLQVDTPRRAGAATRADKFRGRNGDQLAALAARSS
jgi:hypothetical protein